ncbi:cilia- and flagella-associated protein 299 isoform X1 [Austrofundulus limnaeus]|uniref:Cilia- and flagella-associated protein 299 n=1 Tax=Austrofundulus limnaeus TaxID=52670 RepID=A0A2I4C552_AUSLI|nr:PREDICTED: uncharacterized protein C4orf22 homolog isoform X1 [Austrofundulus limnaeus]
MENSSVGRFYNTLTKFKVYEDYLDSKVTPLDLFYLQSRELARKLVEHGHKGPVLSRQDFQERKAAAQAKPSGVFYSCSRAVILASAGKELKDNFLKALAEREEANRSGKMTDGNKIHTVSSRSGPSPNPTRAKRLNPFPKTTQLQSIIFIRDYNPLGQEVSGYIDYAHRLKTQDFEPYFSERKRLMPGRSDLCYYNWRTQVSSSNSSSNFQVVYDDPGGLLFRNKKDKKILNLDPWSGPGEASSRTLLQSDLYVHVVLFDHAVRAV